VRPGDPLERRPALRSPLEGRPTLVGAVICPLAISAVLFARDHRKVGALVGIWGPSFVRLADLLKERIES
jgi:hypothetical protein